MVSERSDRRPFIFKKEVALINDEKVRDLLLVSMSAIIVNVSNQESDTRYAAINKNINLGKTITLFMKKSNDLINFHKHFMKKIPRKNVKVKIFQTDTRDLKFIPKNSVDIIITSPPYANTYDYYLYHKHRMRWLSMDVSYAQYNEIGSRREFSSLKESPDKWKNDIARCMRELIRITKKNGLFLLLLVIPLLKVNSSMEKNYLIL